MDVELKKLAISLFEIDAIKFGEFVTKVGLKSPVYFDLRVIISQPKVMVTDALVVIDREQGGKKNIEADGINMWSLYSVTSLLAYLVEADKITPTIRKDVLNYLSLSQAPVIVNQGK
ncbi:uridine 5'-monophosphate synthase-like [Megalopta genalis]|uniref:uridine 5'-monophosphate synthase-like n=1 Tax=Megalopta genalis TaxID=115081 RepID=UPI003FCEFBD1